MASCSCSWTFSLNPRPDFPFHFQQVGAVLHDPAFLIDQQESRHREDPKPIGRRTVESTRLMNLRAR